MTVELNKVADILEKVAVYVDALDAEREGAITADRNKLASIFKDRYEEMTGDTIDEDVLQKIAGTDVDILHTIEQLTKVGSNDGSLGAPGDRADSNAPMTVKEAAEAADDTFLDFILS